MILKIYIGYLCILSVIAFVLYVTDKQKAKKREWRISEKTLLLLSFFGGAIGGYLAMLTVRHKTKHWYFYAVNLLGLLWQAVLLFYLCKL